MAPPPICTEDFRVFGVREGSAVRCVYTRRRFPFRPLPDRTTGISV
jgi:hypothetical protein